MSARCGGDGDGAPLMRAVWPPGAPAVCLDQVACRERAARPAPLDWQTSREHRGLQGAAFPEAATRPEQGALL